MAGTINAEWLNRNSLRAYPFRENVLRRPTIDGAKAQWAAIPQGLLLDLVLATNFDPQPDIYLKSLSFSEAAVSMTVANASDGAVLAAVTAVPDGSEYVPVNFSGAGAHDDIRGTAVFGDIRRIAQSYPDGIYSFEPEETMFEARCCRPSIPCVSGIYLTDSAGGSASTRLRGDVALVAGANIRLDFVEEDNAIVINADTRYGFNDKCGCEDERSPIESVNGINARELVIEGGDCVSVEKKEGRIIISDTCAKPCCGCAELTFLNQKTNEITTAIGKLDDYSRRLDERLNEFVRNVLLSDRRLSEYL